jgi:hypothetical protein
MLTLEICCRADADQDEVFGLHPLRGGSSPAKPDGQSEDDSDGPLALWAQWQRGRTAAGGDPLPSQPAQAADAPTHQASMRLGQCFAAWVPGLFGRLLQSFGAAGSVPSAGFGAASEQEAGHNGGQPSGSGYMRMQQGYEQTDSPTVVGNGPQQQPEQPTASWLEGGLAADLSVGSLQVPDAKLSSPLRRTLHVPVTAASCQAGPAGTLVRRLTKARCNQADMREYHRDELPSCLRSWLHFRAKTPRRRPWC